MARIATKAANPWTGIDWHGDLPAEANRYDIAEAKARIVSERMPALYQQVIHMLADGFSINMCEQFVPIGEDTIRWIKRTHQPTIAKVKETVLDNLLESVQVMSERLAREAHEIPTQRLATALAQTIDRVQLLSGGVTQRTETRKVVTREELQQLFESLPRAKAKTIEDKKNAD
jgi:hypothetical protein